MPASFRATQFAVVEENDALIASLGAPSTDEDGCYLMLQRGLAPDQQDVDLGMDKPYLEYCTQGWSWYGEIESFELFSTRVVARMSRRAALEMQNDGVIGAEFDLEARDFSKLQQALERIFRGCSCFFIRR